MITPRHTPIKSQNDTVKAHMLAGHAIDTWQAYKLYNITSLAQRVYDLKKSGMPIKSKMVTKNSKTYSIYWIDSEVIQSYQKNPDDIINESVESEAHHDVK
ncbi:MULTISPECIES: helix-turn-helix domain-containing protein [Psychrobacter]|uniref:helix-turn-helix domain-containing protein n=1 Tax=Psychrobacter TaxID=497 RepID=UPI003FD41F7A